MKLTELLMKNKRYAVFIKNMKPPESCAMCRFCSVYDDFRCMAMPPDQEDAYMDVYVVDEEKPDDCPAVGVCLEGKSDGMYVFRRELNGQS